MLLMSSPWVHDAMFPPFLAWPICSPFRHNIVKGFRGSCWRQDWREFLSSPQECLAAMK